MNKISGYDMDSLAQPAPVQEPVAWVTGFHAGRCVIKTINPAAILPVGVALYTTQPAQEFVCSTGLCHYKAQREWVGLSEEEVDKLKHMIDWTASWSYTEFAHALAHLLKEKNSA